MRYIDADEIHYINNTEVTTRRLIDMVPTAEVVKRGRWLTTDAYPHRIYCSNCYETYALDHWGIWIDESLPRNYCPNCGVKMEGGAE